ncbi:gamma-butyrobetaine hydroxylase-like domain-containing protein [Vreelandella jeotgali]|uniref:gamma-butyrobetaine hydroxylase-like domain-containing protein n=1 Tax=Vreelandella jeotgali TaxID=553386 RepID=UPI0003477A3C|nr:DUF971 domain-containing protein [Halomonas jeotgali]
MGAPVPSRVHYHKKARQLELGYPGGETYRVAIELLRVFSPSAEVRGHSDSEAVLQVGKKDVGLRDITQTGNYALKLHFDDGHETGLYTWEYLYDLASRQDAWWDDYLTRMHEAGASRTPLGIEIKSV